MVATMEMSMVRLFFLNGELILMGSFFLFSVEYNVEPRILKLEK
jgi:hypothetical protein